MKVLLKEYIRLLSNPKQGFASMHKKTLDEIVLSYFILLSFSAALMAAFLFVFNILRALYFDFLSKIFVDYLLVFAYGITTSVAVVFLYFFVGTFFFFFTSLVLRFFLRRIDYVEIVKILLLSATPLLLFGWIPVFYPSVLLWGGFLFHTGLGVFGKMGKKKKSIERRE